MECNQSALNGMSPKDKRFESQIIVRTLLARKPKGITRIARTVEFNLK
jgi:hypothetical protein